MKTRRTKALIAALAGIVAVTAFAGCDASEDADLDNGRQLFIAQCGVCHILKEAGTTADIGPDLDAAFAASRAVGQDQDTFEGVTEAQIENPREVPEDDPTYMPGDIVTGDDARDVAAYVASVAGVPGIEAPTAPGGEGGQVYANNGCGACHQFAAAESQGAVGPNLDDAIPGQDAAMVEQSIVDPSAELSQGFDNLMPAGYGDSIEPQDLDLLVRFLTTCAGKVEEGSNGELEGPPFCFNEDE